MIRPIPIQTRDSLPHAHVRGSANPHTLGVEEMRPGHARRSARGTLEAGGGGVVKMSYPKYKESGS